MSDEQREVLEMDVVFVGAGPASLAGAYHLARLIAGHNQRASAKLEVSIAVLEKGKDAASHALSGAVVDPRALRELLPDSWHEAPFEGKVEHEELLLLTSKRAFSLPIPPPLENDGNYVASVGKLMKWLAPKVEAAGVERIRVLEQAPHELAQLAGALEQAGVDQDAPVRDLDQELAPGHRAGGAEKRDRGTV